MSQASVKIKGALTVIMLVAAGAGHSLAVIGCAFNVEEAAKITIPTVDLAHRCDLLMTAASNIIS